MLNRANMELKPVCVAGAKSSVTMGCNAGNVTEKEKQFTTHTFAQDLRGHLPGKG